ncbi:PRC-barrel domain-containing protein, partial [Francisella tularensis]|uniref:PRC-barrel domain-containing protein n=1 Tax=Francisella tularensis TaxID=263 RepID=UPI002381B6F4
KDIMLNTNTGKVAYVVVSYGGFLGMVDKLFAFPIKAFKVYTANAQFKIKKKKEELEEAPCFDKNNWPETSSDYSYFSQSKSS